MSTLKEIEKVLERGKKQAEKPANVDFQLIEQINHRGGKSDIIDNKFYYGNNIDLLRFLSASGEYKGKLDLIYIDPPFYSGSAYDAVIDVADNKIKKKAYEDRWHKGLYEYLKELSAGLILMKDLLAETGTIWLHLDWHVVHYAKIIMDDIFGNENFVNEIIWTYKSGGSSSRRFARKHDNILVYSKTGKYKFNPIREKSYNRQLKPYRFKGVKEYKDEQGWYTLVNMKDVWTIDMVGRTSSERTGYATQKPEQLIERIVESCTDEGDLVADFFCGSGTLPKVAAAMGRNFIVCDRESLSMETTLERIADTGSPVSVLGSHKMNRSGGPKGLTGQFSVKREDIPGGKEKHVVVELAGVSGTIPKNEVSKDDRDLLKKLNRDDPLELVSSFSVDFDYDGKVHRPRVIRTGKKGRLEATAEGIAPAHASVSIKMVDVLGNISYYRE